MVTRPEQQETWFQRNEIPRKVLHGSIAVISTTLYLKGVQSSRVTPVLISALIPISILEFCRFSSKTFNSMYVAVVGPLMRDGEKKNTHVNGVIWYLVGLIVVFAFFPKDICFLSIFLLSWADLAASTIGRAYGHCSFKLVGNKSLVGTTAAFFTGFLCTIVVYEVLLPMRPEYNPPSSILYHQNLSELSLTQLATIMGFAVAVSELFPIIDDNLSIPITCACVQYFVVKKWTYPYTYGVFK